MDLNVGSVIAYLKLDTSKFDGSLKTSQQTMQQFGKSMQRMGLYMTVGLTYPLYRLAKSAVKSFSTFNDAIIRAAAVTVGMTKEMRKEMEKTAIQMSKSSLFSATELAEGYFALGQAGYTAAQQIKILPTVEQFATAATIDLDTAIRYLARTAEGLGMSMETPAEMMASMEKVSNAFTFAAITTTAEIEDFAVAMTHAAAPALKLVNKSMKEGISVLMAFARAGIVAEEAGTLLWTTVRDLQRANIKFRSEWKRFGIDVYDDVTRNMRNMADIFSDLEDKFANMSDESKKASLQMLGFQDRSLRGIQALMGFSDEMKLFQKAMDEMGNLTERVADTYKKSFNAQMKMAKHNIQAVGISIGWMLSPILIKINEQIKRFATWWEELSNSTKFLVIEIVGLVAILGPLLLIFGKMVATLGWMSIGFTALGKAITTVALAFGHVLLAVIGPLAIVGLLIAAAYTLRAAWTEGVAIIKERMLRLQNSFKWTFEYLKNAVGPFLIWMVGAFHDTFGLIISDWDDFSADLIASFMATWDWIKHAASKGKDAMAEIWKDPWITWRQSLEKFKKAVEEADNVWYQSFESGREGAAAEIEAFKKDVMAGFTTAEIYIKAYGEATTEHLTELGQALRTRFGKDVAWVADMITEKVEMMNKNFLKLLPDEDMKEIVIALDKVAKKMKELGGKPPPIDRWDIFLTGVANLTERTTDIAINAFTNLTDTIATQLEQGKADWKEFGAAVLQEINRMIIGMILAEEVYKNFLKPLWEGTLFEGGIKQEDPGAGVAVAITTAGTTMSTAITASGNGVAGAIVLAGHQAAAAIYAAASGNAAAGIAGGIAGGMLGGGFSGPASSSTEMSGEMFSDYGGYAKGAAFAFGKVTAMAKGYVTRQPTMTPMALMGEAGPEAVMPLTRGPSGELGVKATQPNVNFNPQMKVIIVRDEKEAQLETMRSSAGEKIIVQKVARNRNVLG